MKYQLYHVAIKDGVLGSLLFNEVAMTPNQIVDLKGAGFSFAKELLETAQDSPSLHMPMVVISDDDNWFAKIQPHHETLEECLTLGAKFPCRSTNEAQLEQIFGGTEKDMDDVWHGTADGSVFAPVDRS